MFRFAYKKLATVLLPAVALVTPTFPAYSGSHAKETPSATMEITNWNVGFVLGYGGGRGTLSFEGKSHGLKIEGLRVGAAAGIAKARV